MADHTSFTQRLVFKHERAALSCVALEASLILTEQSGAATLEVLGHGGAPFDRVSFMRVMTISAAHFPFQHRVMIRQFECRAHFQVALEACVRRFARVHDRV